MKSAFFLALLLVAATSPAAGRLTAAHDLAEWTADKGPVEFELEVRVDCVVINGQLPHFFLSVADASGSAFISAIQGPDVPLPQNGDLVRLRGALQTQGRSTPIPHVRELTVIRHQAPVPPEQATLRDINNGLHNWKHVRIQGLVRDIVVSETTPDWAILSICADGDIVRIHIPLAETVFADLDRLVGGIVEVTGYPNPNNGSPRLFAGCDFHCPGISALRIVSPGPVDIFDVPSALSLLHKSPGQIATSGRVKARGQVLCTWGKNNGLVWTKDIGCVQVEFDATDIPERHANIEVSGFPQTDLFHIMLSRVQWRFLDTPSSPVLEALETSAKDILTDGPGVPAVKPHFHGRTIRISGRIRSLPDNTLRQGVLLIEDGDFVFPVDFSSVQAIPTDISVGCRIVLTGTCVINAEYWRPGLLVPQIKNFSVIVSDANDIRVVEHPPWWTTQRLLLLISALLAGFLVILFWNFLLRRASLRKGRELMQEQLGHVTAELKTEERTRLAVELHDSLAQNLTGVSLEIDTAAKVADDDPEAMKTHLGIAARSLKSCRDELRNCLWDLRNRALEARTMDDAIRQTLAPHVTGTDVTIRFNVPRERISDNTAHTILRIIRELTLNGIRHGNATKVWIAGSVDGERMLFSVRDNGRGFDPDNAPGFNEGHYGLLGIRERVDEFEGEFALKSSPGTGTKATISLKVPQEA